MSLKIFSSINLLDVQQNFSWLLYYRDNYSRRHNDWRLVFFIILYPYFTLKGLIFILEVKFQSFLVEPTHMPDLSSEEFDLSAKNIGNWGNFRKTWFLPFWPHFDLNKNEICAFRDTIFWEPFLWTSRKLIWRGH